ncbi:MAG: hypothetical protein PHG69_06660, partial [Candidatus Omnitrophica bacterium]|nr:hypothetical protein [Candidatus Omnitrophota bacterium]
MVDILEAINNHSERVLEEFVDNLPVLIETLGSVGNIWRIFVAAQGILYIKSSEKEFDNVTAVLDFINNASKYIEAVGIENAVNLSIIYRIFEFLPVKNSYVEAYASIIAGIIQNRGGKQERSIQTIKVLMNDIMVYASNLSFNVVNVDMLGYRDEDSNLVIQQLLRLNKMIKTTPWGGDLETDAIREKKRKGAKVFVMYVDVNGEKKIIGQVVLVGNFLRLLGVLDIFQKGFNVGTQLELECLKEAIHNGYTSLYMYVRSENKPMLSHQKRILQKLSAELKRNRDDFLKPYGLSDSSNPGVETRDVNKYGGVFTEVRYHFMGIQTAKELLYRYIGDTSDHSISMYNEAGEKGLLFVNKVIRQATFKNKYSINSLVELAKNLTDKNLFAYYPHVVDEIYNNLAKLHFSSEAIEAINKFIISRQSSEDGAFIRELRGFMSGFIAGTSISQKEISQKVKESMVITVSGGATMRREEVRRMIAQEFGAFNMSVAVIPSIITYIAQLRGLNLYDRDTIVSLLEELKNVEFLNDQQNFLRIFYCGNDITEETIGKNAEYIKPMIDAVSVHIFEKQAEFWVSFLKGVIASGRNIVIHLWPRAASRIRDMKSIEIYLHTPLYLIAKEFAALMIARYGLKQAYLKLVEGSSMLNYRRLFQIGGERAIEEAVREGALLRAKLRNLKEGTDSENILKIFFEKGYKALYFDVEHQSSTEIISIIRKRFEIVAAGLDANDIIRSQESYKQTVNMIESGDVRAILLAGPTAAGKTNIINLFVEDIAAAGKRKIMISLDRYIKSRSEFPITSDGSLDIDNPVTVHWDWLASDLNRLFNGEEIELPNFDIVNGESMRHSGEKIALGKDDILVLESLWALTDFMPALPSQLKA